jgi:phage shock protein A
MSFFSRLSDIVTCRIEELLAKSQNPSEAIARIVAEMEEGLAGAQRSLKAAQASEQRLEGELSECRSRASQWSTAARDELAAGKESEARAALFRKRETEDLLAGLEHQLAAAASTREHMATMLRAIEARLADARRRQLELKHPAGSPAATAAITTALPATKSRGSAAAAEDPRAREIEEELQALRRELGKSP